MPHFETLDVVLCDPSRATVFEHGWQSWSPTGTYAGDAISPRAVERHAQIRNYRPGVPGPATGFQGEGLLAVQPEPHAPVSLFALPDPAGAVPSIRATTTPGGIMVSANGPVTRHDDDGPGGIAGALERFAARTAIVPTRPLPTVWCSWYCHWADVAESDIAEALSDLDQLHLPIDVVQVDDGYQAEIGDWLHPSPRFSGVGQIAGRIRDGRRRAGIWTAPFLATQSSSIVAEHPEWFGREVDAGVHWGQQLYVLDVTHPGAAEHLTHVFRQLAGYGFDYFKVDFVYAGALEARRHADVDPLDAYRLGIQLIRDAIGPDAILVGCGAPMFPSIGLFDAMRVSPDVDPAWLPKSGDHSAPSMRNALTTGAARQFTHRHWWVNDPDCLMARPEVPHRERWAAHVGDTAGLISVSDRIRDLDAKGREIYHEILNSGRLEEP